MESKIHFSAPRDVQAALGVDLSVIVNVGAVVDGEHAIAQNEDALRREIREEVGIEIEDVRFLMTSPNFYLYKGVTYPVCDLLFLGRALAPESARALDGVAGLEWRTLESLDEGEFAFESMRAALRRLRISSPPSEERSPARSNGGPSESRSV